VESNTTGLLESEHRSGYRGQGEQKRGKEKARLIKGCKLQLNRSKKGWMLLHGSVTTDDNNIQYIIQIIRRKDFECFHHKN
jgi:hypothetical protein